MTILDGQHALITGGGSGIGLACARALINDGAAVTLLGRRENILDQACQHLGEHAAYAVVDIGDEVSLADAIEGANTRMPLSIIIANAGTGGAAPLLQTSSEEWRKIMQTNLDGTFFTLKHGGSRLAENGGGAMCAISSIAGLRTHKYMGAYCASKAGIDMLVRNAADELGTANIRVNSVCPGLVETDLSAGLHQHEAMKDDYLACMPVSRVGQSEDIAHAVRFLCGPEAGWITGVTLPVDGGHHLRRGPNIELLSG